MTAALQQQVQAMVEELGVLKGEIVNLKQSHAGLHQSAVDASGHTNRALGEMAQKVEKIEGKLAEVPGAMGAKKLSLIEPKQVTVEEYSGAVSDSRNKFIEWSERCVDRVQLYDPLQ